MAFNWQTFRTRALTAIVFVVVMLGGLLWNQWSLLLLFTIIHFGCWWEFLKLLEKIHRINYHPYIKLGLMVAGYGWLLWFCGPMYSIDTYGIKQNLPIPVSAAGFVLLIVGIFQKNRISFKTFGAAALGIFYISLSWGMMINLSDPYFSNDQNTSSLTHDVALPLLIIASIWINDTMAYIVGSLIGKTQFSAISPKKTWEGTIGGIILAIAAVGIAFTNFYSHTDNMTIGKAGWYIAVAIAAIAGAFGDLLESKLKRMAGVKDSGHIMPGHGGFLDRFDSLLIATPFVWLFLKLVMT